MNRNERVTTEIHNDGYRWFEEFLVKLSNVRILNEHNPWATQRELKRLIEKGEDMVEKLKDQARSG